MIKKLILMLYIPGVLLRRKLLNFILPNFFSVKRYKISSIPNCQQKVVFTGRGITEIGENCSLGSKLGGFHKYGYIEFQARYPNARIKLGDNVSINNNVFICASNNITIGSATLIGQNVTMMDFEAHGTHRDERRTMGAIGSIVIENNVWIGNNVLILRDTYIGENSIIAAGAVVKGVFPKDVIIGGVPATVIKSLV